MLCFFRHKTKRWDDPLHHKKPISKIFLSVWQDSSAFLSWKTKQKNIFSILKRAKKKMKKSYLSILLALTFQRHFFFFSNLLLKKTPKFVHIHCMNWNGHFIYIHWDAMAKWPLKLKKKKKKEETANINIGHEHSWNIFELTSTRLQGGRYGPRHGVSKSRLKWT